MSSVCESSFGWHGRRRYCGIELCAIDQRERAVRGVSIAARHALCGRFECQPRLCSRYLRRGDDTLFADDDFGSAGCFGGCRGEMGNVFAFAERKRTVRLVCGCDGRKR